MIWWLKAASATFLNQHNVAGASVSQCVGTVLAVIVNVAQLLTQHPSQEVCFLNCPRQLKHLLGAKYSGKSMR